MEWAEIKELEEFKELEKEACGLAKRLEDIFKELEKKFPLDNKDLRYSFCIGYTAIYPYLTYPEDDFTEEDKCLR